MRIAVMSDIHGFSLAFETVRDDLARTAGIDETIVAGDHCEVGPDPVGVIASLQSSGYTILQGNTDRDLVEIAHESRSASRNHFAVDQVGEPGIAFLADLTFSRRITPPGGNSPDDDLLVVHANPRDLDRKLHPDMSDRELQDVLGDTKAAVIAFGHVHIAYTRRVGDVLLADISAVGNPKDRDLRCKYGIFNWDESTGTWNVEMRRLPYPLEATAAQIRASALPNPQRTLKQLQRASY